MAWFWFYCERCGRNSETEGFLLNGDYGDCYPCLDCQAESDVAERPMSFRPATNDELQRLEKKKYEDTETVKLIADADRRGSKDMNSGAQSSVEDH